jgi:hypothetical protein
MTGSDYLLLPDCVPPALIFIAVHLPRSLLHANPAICSARSTNTLVARTKAQEPSRYRQCKSYSCIHSNTFSHRKQLISKHEVSYFQPHLLLLVFILSQVINHQLTWSRTLREEHRLKVFENRALRGTSGPKRDSLQWRKGGENCVMRAS